MPSQSEQPFRTNANKDHLRSVYDQQIVEAWSKSRRKRLKYLGLPGPEMLDVIAWQDYIGNFSTIERRENEQHFLFLRANVKDIEHRLHSLYGEFDDILLTGRDQYNHTPNWPYDLVNLDFYGGFLYRDPARPRAVKKLIENQGSYSTSFLLIISYHLRDADLVGEKLSFLDDLERKLARDSGDRSRFAGVIAWYRNEATPDAARQSLYMNFFLHDEGEAAHFEVHCRPAIVYSGTGGARMIHFVTEFEHKAGAHRAVSPQSLIDVANLGYLELEAGRLTEPIAVPRVRKSRTS